MLKRKYGVGVNDMVGKWFTRGQCRASNSQEFYQARVYTLWSDMLRRCYSENWLSKHPSYIGCFVCDRWLYLSKFIEDLPYIMNYQLWLSNPNSRVCLDKDILVPGNKEYCLESCQFVTLSDSAKDVVNRCGIPSPSIIGRKQGAVKRGEKMAKGVKATSIKNGDVLIFNSLSDVKTQGFNPGHVSECYRGKRHKHKGYTWEYC